MALFGQCLLLLGVGCFFVIVRHAFKRSLGTGVMVLLVPLFALYYAFVQFDHRRKGLIVVGAFAAMVSGVVLRNLGVLHYTQGVDTRPQQTPDHTF